MNDHEVDRVLIEALSSFEMPMTQVFDLTLQLQEKDESHELCLLLAPLVPKKVESLVNVLEDMEAHDRDMQAMWQALRERFLCEGTYSENVPLTDEQTAFIFEELRNLLTDALQKASGAVEHVVGS